MPDNDSQSGATPPANETASRDARSGGQQHSGSDATSETGSKEGARPDTSLGEAGQAALDRERGARREAERQASEYRKRLAEAEDAGKPELERAQSAYKRANAESETHRTRVVELERELAQMQLRDLRRQVATERQLPVEMADRLKGDDLRSLRADAEALARQINAGQPVGSVGIGRGGAATSKTGRVSMNDLIREQTGR